MVASSDQLQLEKFYGDSLAQKYFEDLKDLVAIKSVYAQNIGLQEAAQKLVKLLRRRGLRLFLMTLIQLLLSWQSLAVKKLTLRL